MTFPSISLIIENFITTLKRFPFVVIVAVIGTLLSMYSIEVIDDNIQEMLMKIIITTSLGLPLFFAASMFSGYTQKPFYQWSSALVSICVLAVFYFTTAIHVDESAKYIYRYGLWLISFHLLVAFATFFKHPHLQQFWQYNKHLFLRFLTAALYSGVLYLGLAGAILAVAELFNINISWKRYWQLFVFISGIFNTLFFLGGMPKNIFEYYGKYDYPKGLKLFTQYVLIPLVSIYLIILYAYLGKIIIELSLPKGWVANLIIAFSVSGIFSLLLIYPIKDDEGNAWINIFSRFFYFSLVPMVVLLFVAIGRRINDYGITIERYFVASLGVWLAFITLYFIFSKKKNIIFIPVSLAIMFTGITTGPWGAFQVSEKNQLYRFEKILEANKLLANGKLVVQNNISAQQISKQTLYQVGSILRYLNDNHDLNGIKKYLDLNNSLVVEMYHDSTNKYEKLQLLRKYTGIPFKEYETYGVEEKNIDEYYSFYTENSDKTIVVTGYDTLSSFYAYQKDRKTNIDTSSHAYIDNNELQFYKKGKLKASKNLTVYCRSLIKNPEVSTNNYGTRYLPESLQKIFFSDSSGNVIIIHHLEFSERNDTITLQNVEGYLLMK